MTRDLPHSPWVPIAVDLAWEVHRLLGDRRAVKEFAERELALANEIGSPFALTYGVFHHGWSLMEEGQVEVGLAEMRSALAALEATGVVATTWMAAAMAECYRKIGHAEQGLKILSLALAVIERTGDRLFEAELHRLNGELLALRDTVEPGSRAVEVAAEGCFQRAIHVASRQGARLLELRATTSLARLLAKRGNRDEARAMLAEIYNWFTEGFDTADLRDAKGLLDEISGRTRLV